VIPAAALPTINSAACRIWSGPTALPEGSDCAGGNLLIYRSNPFGVGTGITVA
jgi:hypothetical protein